MPAVFVALATSTCLVFMLIFLMPPVSDNGFGCLEYKHTRLATAASPRLILMGGSNLFYGVDCLRLKRELRYEPVNMGMCYMFGLPFLSSEIYDSIKPGDLVVLSPEPELFSNLEQCANSTTSVLEPYPGAIRWVFPWALNSWSRSEQLFLSLRRIFAQKAIYWSRHALDILGGSWSWKSDEKVPDYNFDNLDMYGDYLGHLKRKSPPQESIDTVIYGPELNPKSPEMRSLLRLKKQCDRRGAKLVIIPCPMPEETYRNDKSPLDNLYAGLSLLFPNAVLASQARYTFSLDTFFDSRYHLKNPGRDQRTTKLIEDIKHFLGR